MTTQEKSNLVAQAEAAAPFFRVNVSIELFGKTIFSWSWPPKKS